MLILDSVANVALSVEDVCALDASRISNPVMFRKFAVGLRVDEDFLLNDRWEKMPALNAPSMLFGAIMQEMLPVSYDAGWLEGLGGSFSIRITGVGEYTLISMSRRVVTLCGLATDAATNEQTIDLEIAPEVMLAFCRGLLLEMAEDVLSDEDEFEDREISSAELLFNGMPSGGYDFGASLKDARAGNVGFLNANAAASGTIEKSGDQDWFAVMLNAGVTYRIDLRGSGSGRGTLSDPMIYGIVNATGTSMGLANDDAIGLESRIVFTPTSSGTYYIAAGAYSAGTGSYQIQVVNNAYTEPLLPSVEAGGDFASDITSARNERIGSVAINGLAKGTINASGDKDWYAVTLSAGTTYRIDLRGAPSARGTLSDPYLWAIHDSSGTYVDNYGNVRPDGTGRAFNDDSNSTLDSMVVFTPQRTDTYYISAAGYSSSIGTYQLTVSTDTNGYGTANELTSDFGGNYSAAVSGKIGYFTSSSFGTGRLSTYGDVDWFAVDLYAGTTYRIDVMGSPTSNGTLVDPVLEGIYLSNGTFVKGTRDDDSGDGWDAQKTFTPSSTGTYYIGASSSGYGYMGTYMVSATPVAVTANDMTGYLRANESGYVDFAYTVADALAGKVGVIYANSSGSGTVSFSGDLDTFAVTLNGGQTYRIDMVGAPSGNGTLANPKIQNIINDAGNQVNSGNDNYGNSLESRVDFTPTTSGIYYIRVASGDTSLGTYKLSVSGAEYSIARSTSICGSAFSVCGAKASASGADICGSATSTCVTNTSAQGQKITGVGLSVCGNKVTAYGLKATAVDVSACGSNFFLYGARGCGVVLSACGARVGGTLLAVCGADASVCGARATITGLSVCGSNASVCTVRAGVDICSGYGVACLVDFGFGVDVGACIVNVLPIVPSG